MSYIPFTEQQREQARRTDLAAFLRQCGEEVKRSGSENMWLDHGQKVTIRGNLWFHQYEQVGGDAIDFACRFYNMEYPEAVQLKVYDDVTSKFDVQFVAMDAGYKTPWIAKKTLDDGKIPVLPYTRYKGSKEGYRPWDYKYDPVKDVFTCPHGQELRHTTTDRDGKRIYRSTPKYCVNCLSKSYCKANEKGQKVFTTHIWQEYLDIVESIRKTDLGKQIYAQRKETIERVFADAKEKHAMRYTHHRGLAAVTRWVRLKFAAMNLKKLAQWSWKDSMFSLLFVRCCPIYKNAPTFAY